MKVEKIDAIKLKKYLKDIYINRVKDIYIICTYFKHYLITITYIDGYCSHVLYDFHMNLSNIISKLLFSNDFVKIKLGLNLLQ
jgi:hypothetical protein